MTVSVQECVLQDGDGVEEGDGVNVAKARSMSFPFTLGYGSSDGTPSVGSWTSSRSPEKDGWLSREKEKMEKRRGKKM